MKNILLIGAGEVGKAITKLEQEKNNQVHTIDIAIPSTPDEKILYDVIHICFPYNDNFIESAKIYLTKYISNIVIIHSTVAVGTTRKIQEIIKRPVFHSPIRGVHPNLYDGILTFVKYLAGGPDLIETAKLHLDSLGIKVEIVGSPETTELGKLLDTSYYGWNIIFAKEVKRYCDKYDLDYNLVYRKFNETYNSGYVELGMPHVARPILNPPIGPIGGHCVTNNYLLLDDSGLKRCFLELDQNP
jgi:UDP-N-acetyl-D-mannosaminuronate dehydrogenase